MYGVAYTMHDTRTAMVFMSEQTHAPTHVPSQHPERTCLGKSSDNTPWIVLSQHAAASLQISVYLFSQGLLVVQHERLTGFLCITALDEVRVSHGTR